MNSGGLEGTRPTAAPAASLFASVLSPTFGAGRACDGCAAPSAASGMSSCGSSRDLRSFSSRARRPASTRAFSSRARASTSMSGGLSAVRGKTGDRAHRFHLGHPKGTFRIADIGSGQRETFRGACRRLRYSLRTPASRACGGTAALPSPSAAATHRRCSCRRSTGRRALRRGAASPSCSGSARCPSRSLRKPCRD